MTGDGPPEEKSRQSTAPHILGRFLGCLVWADALGRVASDNLEVGGANPERLGVPPAGISSNGWHSED